MRWSRALLVAAVSLLAGNDAVSAATETDQSKMSMVASIATLSYANSIVAVTSTRRFLRVDKSNNANVVSSYSFKNIDDANDDSEVDKSSLTDSEERAPLESFKSLKSMKTFSYQCPNYPIRLAKKYRQRCQ